MKTGAVVVRWRGGDEVDRCLRSLLDHGGPNLGRIVLVDSGSGDGGADRLARAFPEVEVVALETNHSFAHAANRGAEHLDGDALLLLNPDTEATPGAVGTLIEALDEDPQIAGVVPLLTHPDGTLQDRWQLRRLPTAVRLATGRPGAPAFNRSPVGGAPVEQPAAAAWLIRREVWRRLEGLDERYAPAWWEDVDFCARLQKAVADPSWPWSRGFVVTPGARLVHQGGSSVAALKPQDFLAAYFGNLMRYAVRHHRSLAAPIGLVLRASLIGRSAIRPSQRGAYLDACRAITNTRDR